MNSDKSTSPAAVELASKTARLQGTAESFRVEADVAERHYWLETMINHIPDFIYAKDLEGRFLFANQAVITNNGLTSVEEIIGKTDFEFLPLAAAQGVTEIERRVMETGEADLGFEELAERGDRERWLMMSRIPLRDTAGRVIGVVGASRDITTRKSAERVMKAQSHLLEMIARGTPLPDFLRELAHMIAGTMRGVHPSVMLVSADRKELHLVAAPTMNEAYRDLANVVSLSGDPLGMEQTTAKAMSGIFEQAAVSTHQHVCRCMAISGVNGEIEAVLVLHIVVGRPDFAGFKEFLSIAVQMTGIAIARNHAEAQIGFLAHHDALTGMENRAMLDQRLTTAVATADAQGKGMALAFLDLDNFKLVNDSLGHAVGDELLKTVAARITELVANRGTLARIGGDEFVLILDEWDAENCLHQLSTIRQAVARPVILDGIEVRVTCSIGVACYPMHGNTAAALLVSADMAMYRAKEMGRDRIELFNAQMAADVRSMLSRTDELRQALQREEFTLHFQPQQDINTGKIIGGEALIRWQHPTEGLVYPGDFIPIAEETGLIVPIGEWVVRTACRVCKDWQDQGLQPIKVSVNVSARQFQEKRFVETIASALSDSGLDPRWLELEITESLIMKDLSGSVAMMQELTALGVSLAVDDFGTGYSSLSALKRFPLSRLKIDRSFIADIPDDTDDMAITSAIVSLAQKLGLKAIAEGVETEAQARFLSESGCNEIQGYLFSRPLPDQSFRTMLEANSAPSQS